jgi:hypothetical protein
MHDKQVSGRTCTANVPEIIRPLDKMALGNHRLIILHLLAKAVKWQLQNNFVISGSVPVGFCECQQKQKKEIWKAVTTEFLQRSYIGREGFLLQNGHGEINLSSTL